MAEARENKVSGSGELWNNTEFMHEFERVLKGMTEDDWRRLNNKLRQMEEQKTGLYAFLNKNSDDTSKQSNEVSEGVSAVSYTHLDVYKRQGLLRLLVLLKMIVLGVFILCV